MIGSKRESADLYASVVALAKVTPFSLAEISEQVTKLKAYNISTSDLIPTITALGNIASVVGKEKLPQLTLAYGQVSNAGKLMGTELRQFTEAGVDLLGLIQISYGKTKEEVQKMATEHTISFAMVRKALLDASADGGRYEDMMVKLSKTVGGQISNLSDTFQVAKARIGDFFEDQIKSGTVSMNKLIESLVGSHAAIQRTVYYIESAVVAFTTWKVAQSAQKIAQEAWIIVTKAGELVMGTYNLSVIAVKGTTEGLTEAQIASAAAARSTWAAFAANPIGAVVAVLGLAVSAYLAWEAATTDVTEAMSDQEFQLQKEKSELNGLVAAALNAEIGTKRRKDAIGELIAKYPDYFAGLDKEKTTNDQLRAILDKVNVSYRDRIDLAREAYKTDKLAEAKKELFQQEEELFERVKKTNVLNEEVIQSFGGSAQKLSDYMKANKAVANDLNDSWRNLFSGSIGEVARNVAKAQKDIEKGYEESSVKVLAIREKEKLSAIDLENEKHKGIMAQLDDGSKKELAEIERHKIAVSKLDGTYKEKELKENVDHEEKKRNAILVSDKAIAVMKAEGDELTLKQQLDLLNKQEAAEIDAAKRITVNKKISASALAALEEEARKKILAIIAEYNKKEAAIMEQMEAEKLALFIKSSQETFDKMEVLETQRLEATRMNERLSNAKTQEERIAVLKEYNDKYGLALKEAATEQLRIQAEASKQALIDLQNSGTAKEGEVRKAYSKWLADDLQFQTALTAQTVAGTKETAQQIQAHEKEIQEAKKETARIEKETLAIQQQARHDFVSSFLSLFSQEGGVVGQVAGMLKTAFDGFDQLRLKALDTAQGQLTIAQNNLGQIYEMYDAGTAKGAAAIAQGNEAVAAASGNVAKAKADTLAGIAGMFAAAYQIVSSIVGAIQDNISASYQAAADGLGKVRDAYKELYAMVAESGKDAYGQALEAARGNTAQSLAIIQDYYAEQDRLASSTARIDAEIAYQQKYLELKGEQRKFLSAYEQEQADNHYRELARQSSEKDMLQYNIEVLERKKQKAADVRDAIIAGLDAELEAYRKTNQAEQDAIQETSDTKKRALQDQLQAVKDSFADQVTAAKQAYSDQLAALKDAQSAERTAIQETFDLKQSLLEQAASDEIEAITIVDRLRNEAVDRYGISEADKLIKTRDRILATLTDEKEKADVITFYDGKLRDLHNEVEQGKLDKSKGVQIATKQLNQELKDDTVLLKGEEKTALEKLDDDYQVKFTKLADDRDTKIKEINDARIKSEDKLNDQIRTLERDTKTEIDKLKDQILEKEQKTAQDKKKANYDYKVAVMQANSDIFEATKAIKIAELRAEQAILRSKRNFLNAGKINAAIDAIEESVNQISSLSLAYQPNLVEYLDANDLNIYGNPKKPITLNGRGVLDFPVFDAAGNPLTVTYSDSQEQHIVYDASKNEVPIMQATAKDKDGKVLFFEGTDYVERGNNPAGRDTIPAMVNEGERILPTRLNQLLGGAKLSNEHLVDKVIAFEKLTAAFPKMAINTSFPQMRLPAHIMNGNSGGSFDVSKMLSEMKGVRADLKNHKALNIYMDEHGFAKSLENRYSKTTLIQSILTR